MVNPLDSKAPMSTVPLTMRESPRWSVVTPLGIERRYCPRRWPGCRAAGPWSGSGRRSCPGVPAGDRAARRWCPSGRSRPSRCCRWSRRSGCSPGDKASEDIGPEVAGRVPRRDRVAERHRGTVAGARCRSRRLLRSADVPGEVQSVSVVVPPLLRYRPPPLEPAELPLTVQLVSVSVPPKVCMPPPEEAAVLSLIVQSVERRCAVVVQAAAVPGRSCR